VSAIANVDAYHTPSYVVITNIIYPGQGFRTNVYSQVKFFYLFKNIFSKTNFLLKNRTSKVNKKKIREGKHTKTTKIKKNFFGYS
jgi:hypothetical protein